MHARKAARDTYMWDGRIFTDHGDVHFADPFDASRFADAYNVQRGGLSALEAAQTMAMALAHEVLHAVVGAYRTSGAESAHADRFGALVEALRTGAGDHVSAALEAFLSGFPPPAIYAGEEQPRARLTREGATAERWVTEEILLLWVTNQNPAYESAKDIVSDADLPPAYGAMVSGCRAFFEAEGAFGPGGENLVDLLLAPARSAPNDIFAQLEFMERNWAHRYGLSALGLLDRLRAARVLHDQLLAWHAKGPGPGAPKLEAMRFGDAYASGPDIERYSPDTDWMPRVVLLAKSVYVWLDQLSKKYKRAITRLDQIPDEELELAARRGFSAIWFIGLFERSAASRRVKQMRGDGEALASAYSLRRYDIAHELGGEAAWLNLRDRATRFGLRLAADMVPNHVGIDADWVIDHPDWFIQSSTPPFPNYRYSGADLSQDHRVGIFLEDGYWSQTDAAVTFKRLDRWSGEERFIYHGNDGTSMPWNDTAQLDYTKPEVRKAVIDTILHVARMFPIIRFDAAMTLAKKHFQRLWFPLPGSGADIPSRASYAMSQAAFDAAVPEEFWREVVDTVAREAPDTLLLAEAFWLMEGYFVRTLGMHRVYNSAFMNMLKREENAKYRETLKNVLEYDPQILRRFVNFMSNPDEETAVDQFGLDDKYFGVCVLMCTMPGLPMFGHGQVEGLSEKYGMEYARAKSSEQPNEWVIARHEREISPLLHRRHLFAGVDDFDLFDFETEHGGGEDVFAYVNGRGEARALVIYHNKYAQISGSIRRSVTKLRADGTRSTVSLYEALGLPAGSAALVAMRDVSGGLEYLRWADELSGRGLYCELRAFQYYVLTDLRVLADSPKAPWASLARELGNAGVPSLDVALTALHLRPVHDAVRAIVMLAARGDAETRAAAMTEDKLAPLAAALAAGVASVERREGERVRDDDGATDRARGATAEGTSALAAFLGGDAARRVSESAELPVRLAALIELCGAVIADEARGARDWALEIPLRGALGEAEIPADAIDAETDLVMLLSEMPSAPREAMALALDRPRGRALLGIHEHGGVEWLVKERWEELAALVLARRPDATAKVAGAPPKANAKADTKTEASDDLPTRGAKPRSALDELAEQAGFRVARLRTLLAPDAPAPPPSPAKAKVKKSDAPPKSRRSSVPPKKSDAPPKSRRSSVPPKKSDAPPKSKK